MSSRIREALSELETDVAGLRLAPPHVVRARGRARRRRRVAAGVAAAVAVAGVVALPVAYLGGGTDASRPAPAGGGTAWPSPGCPAPSGAPVGDGRQFMVFLRADASAEEKRNAETALRKLTGGDVVFLDRDEQYRRFVQQYCASPDLLSSVQPDQFPEAFQARLTNPDTFDHLRITLMALPAVDEVSPPR